jgi:hypothetical protein
MKTRPESDPQQTAQCVYSIPCECGRSHIGETGRPLAVRLREHRYNLIEGLVEKSRLAQHACEEGHIIGVHLFLLGFTLESHDFTPQMALVVGTVLDSAPFNFMHWCSWACFIS